MRGPVHRFAQTQPGADTPIPGEGGQPPTVTPRSGQLAALMRLARPRQWAKGVFVVIGPAYAVAGGDLALRGDLLADVLGAVLAFGLASSAGYVFNDIRDRHADRAHPRKQMRPLAAGTISVPAAGLWAGMLLALAVLATFLPWLVAWVSTGQAAGPPVPPAPGIRSALLALTVGAYLANTALYTLWLKHVLVLDVISLALGFVLRVMGGCAAAGIAPSPWLMDVVFFLAMFLAFGKRLGESRALGDHASAARTVLGRYTDDLLRMAVVVTAVASLLSYSGYVQDKGQRFLVGFNLLWLTLLPATYGLLRCILLLERGQYDDPTELAARDRPFQAACFLFLLLTAGVMLGVRR